MIDVVKEATEQLIKDKNSLNWFAEYHETMKKEDLEHINKISSLFSTYKDTSFDSKEKSINHGSDSELVNEPTSHLS